jgi:hypothetical protein
MHRAPTGIILAALLYSTSFGPRPARAQTSYPMMMRVDPVALTRGQTAETTVSGQENWSGASLVLCEGPGLRGQVLAVEKVEGPQAKARGGGGGRRGATPQLRARLEVAADAPLGPREVRIATPQGVSSVGLVVVVDDPVVTEADDLANDRPATAQKLTFPTVVSGRIGKVEDVDWYAFEALKGHRVAFEVWGNRLENKIHDLQTHLDPILSVHDNTGRELATADNNRFADPLLSFQPPASDTYYLQVRDTTYGGNAAWSYALHAVSGPVTTSVSPMAVNPGTTARLEVKHLGDDVVHAVQLLVPKDLKPGPHFFALSSGTGGTLPVPLVATSLPVDVESADVPVLGDPARSVKLPVAISGCLGERGDIDGYRFEARKAALYAFEVVARRTGSECDPVLRLMDVKGSVLTEADDTRGLGKDSRFEWTAPGDGTYVLQISDLHDRGGLAFGYVLLAEAARPDFTVTCDPDKINVGPGGRVPVFVKVARRQGFKGAVTLSWDDLPAGISASPLVVPASMDEGEIVVSATPEAKRTAALVTLQGTGQGSEGSLVRRATPEQEIYLPGGGRGRCDVETLALAVTDPSDITVEAVPREVVLAPGESTALEVTVTRNPRYDKPVNLAVVLQHLGRVHGNPLPPGVTVKNSGGKTLLGPSETKGRIILQASSTAPACDRVPIAVMGHVSINFMVKTAYASAPVLVTVRPK